MTVHLQTEYPDLIDYAHSVDVNLESTTNKRFYCWIQNSGQLARIAPIVCMVIYEGKGKQLWISLSFPLSHAYTDSVSPLNKEQY